MLIGLPVDVMLSIHFGEKVSDKDIIPVTNESFLQCTTANEKAERVAQIDHILTLSQPPKDCITCSLLIDRMSRLPGPHGKRWVNEIKSAVEAQALGSESKHEVPREGKEIKKDATAYKKAIEAARKRAAKWHINKQRGRRPSVVAPAPAASSVRVRRPAIPSNEAKQSDDEEEDSSGAADNSSDDDIDRDVSTSSDDSDSDIDVNIECEQCSHERSFQPSSALEVKAIHHARHSAAPPVNPWEWAPAVRRAGLAMEHIREGEAYTQWHQELWSSMSVNERYIVLCSYFWPSEKLTSIRDEISINIRNWWRGHKIDSDTFHSRSFHAIALPPL
jgi:hypothetical protein